MAPERNTAAPETELFRSANLLVRAVGRHCDSVCVVTFACLHEVPGVTLPGFGEAFFRDRQIDAIHVTCGGNDWYQYPELFTALAAIRHAVTGYSRVVAYGSSMGGYAAVRFGAAAGAHEALAISPQFSIDRQRVPFERRWRRPAANIRFLHEGEPPRVAKAIVVYDPLNPDRRHVALIGAFVPLRHLLLFHAGHPAGAYLAEVGLLTELVLATCAGDLPGDLQQRARDARRSSGQYLFSLARRIPRRRLATKLALARRASAVAPHEPVYLSYLALLLAEAGDEAAAEAAHRAAVNQAPELPLVLGRFARFLMRAGRFDEAFAFSATARRLAPDDPRMAHMHAVTLLAAGHWRLSLRMLMNVGRKGVPAFLKDAAHALVWRPASHGWHARFWPSRRVRLVLHLGRPDEIASADVNQQSPPT